MKILITSGATREPIDSVRFISNFSTGSTGAFLAGTLTEKGALVHYVYGMGARQPVQKMPSAYQYSTFQDLDRHLRDKLKSEHFDWIIHAAAVSDFTIAHIEQAGVGFAPLMDVKLDSSQGMTLKLIPNHKIINKLKTASKNQSLRVIGFKLTSTQVETEREEAVQKLFDGGGVDFIVHNDISKINPQIGAHEGTVFSPTKPVGTFQTKALLAQVLSQIIFENSKSAGGAH